MLVAQTLEADVPELAVRDILAQLALPHRLKRNSAAIILCHNAFIESGAARAVCERLPFTAAGVNTFLNASSSGCEDAILMTVCVLTSDRCVFAAGLSEPMDNEVEGPAARLYVGAENLLARRPAMALLFAPLLRSLPAGEFLTAALDSASDGVPIFGTVAADYTTNVRSPRVIFDGEAYPDRAALILIEGPIEPQFAVEPVSLANSVPHKAIVTGAAGDIVTEVNGIPALDFLESLGLAQDGHITGVHTIPVSIDTGDGEPPVVRAIVAQGPGGSIVMGGTVPAGALMGIGAMDKAHILAGMRRISLRQGLSPSSPLLVYSCITRNIVLGFDYTLEADALREGLRGGGPFAFAYSLGEICPVPLSGGRWRNAFHNMTLVAASL
ncbi:MAG: FIST C-terminal domain-containing protein [Deltaproteobacteria bacterium]|jgi:hypothetical protein|nr:FIST C-terminal domain-containing protein [Deltaproteobacteria bacterium]